MGGALTRRRYKANMLRIAYADVLRKVEALYLGSRNEVGVEHAPALQTHLNTAAGQLWEQFFWPEWTLSEQRHFRQSWSAATTYGAPTATSAVERYHVRSGKYFQSLRAANTGNAPMDDEGVENSEWWAESQSNYSGDDYDAGDFAVGDKVRNPDDNRFYQCHTAHTGTATFDSTKFGILTAFKRSIDYAQSWETNAIGAARRIYDKDPEVYFGAAQRIHFNLGSSIFVAGDQAVVWVQFRRRAPQWTGELYSATTTYALAAQAQDNAETGDQDFYKSLAAGNLGNALTDATKWERIDFPWVLRDAAARAAYSEALRGDGQTEKALIEMVEAVKLADKEFEKIDRQQSQGRALPVVA